MITELTIPNAKDRHYFVKSKFFMEVVDSEDIECRESAEIVPSYHIHWFQDGKFFPPVVYFERGVVKFINGRHRTLVLVDLMEEIPVAIAHMDFSSFGGTPHSRSIENFKEMLVREIEEGEKIILPDLPIEYLGFDLNIGK